MLNCRLARFGALVGVMCGAVLLVGCESRRQVRDMSDLGSMHVATLSVTDWEDFRADLSPAFNLDAAGALTAAVPDSRLFESSVLDAFRTRIGLQLAPSAVLTEGFGAPVVPAGSEEGTPATLPGTTGAGQNVPSPAAVQDSALLGSDDSVPDPKGLGGDAFLKYAAATALFQEVKLLERYVRDAVEREGAQAFIVRMQVTNMPSSDRWGYDAYANIGFFSDPVTAVVSVAGIQNTTTRIQGIIDGLGAGDLEGAPEIAGTKLRENLEQLRARQQELVQSVADLDSLSGQRLQLLNAVEDQAVQLARQAMRLADDTASELTAEAARLITAETDQVLVRVAQERAVLEDAHRVPTVVPLLVTDQVESALLSGRHERLRELALAVSAAYAGIGGEVDVQKVDQAIERAAGRSYRSLFTTSRLADNALRVRVGARVLPTVDGVSDGSQYETMARSHFVTVLVLVPRDAGAKAAYEIERSAPDADEWPQLVHLATQFEYRWPDTGERIEADGSSQGDRQSVKDRLVTMIREGGYGVAGVVDPDKAFLLAQLAQGNQYAEFMGLTGSSIFLAEPPGVTPGVTPGATPSAVLVAMDDAVARRLYLDLQIAKIGGSFDGTSFQVTMRDDVSPNLGSGFAYMTDTGNSVEAVIDGVSGLDPAKVSATWSGLIVKSGQLPVSVASIRAEIRGSSQLVVHFPSLVGLKIISKGDGVNDDGSIDLRHPNASDTSRTVGSFIATGEPKKPALSVKSAVSKLTLAQGSTTGSLQVQFGLTNAVVTPVGARNPAQDAKNGTHYVVSLLNAQVTGLTPSSQSSLALVPGTIASYVVYESGVVTFGLDGLNTDGVKIVTKSPKGADAVDDVPVSVE